MTAEQTQEQKKPLTLEGAYQIFGAVPPSPVLINEFEFCTTARGVLVLREIDGSAIMRANMRGVFQYPGSMELRCNGRELLLIIRDKKADEVDDKELLSRRHEWRAYYKKDFLPPGEEPKWTIEYQSSGGIDYSTREGQLARVRDYRIGKAWERLNKKR